MTIYELKVDVEKLLKEKQGQIDKLKSQLEKQQFERNEALDDLACAIGFSNNFLFDSFVIAFGISPVVFNVCSFWTNVKYLDTK
ncbi:hypothetical protein [Lactococcus petauri]|uniref:hypothetical protein n=1 Tax=Lactococcus petauri TaxID=1940789 RepID=UPI001F569096|nr:hypothetical protein [Lactococcus petauri]